MRQEFETFMARLYTDHTLRARFVANPRGEAERHDLTREECDALAQIDRAGLEIASQSFAHKRALKDSRPPQSFWKRLFVRY